MNRYPNNETSLTDVLKRSIRLHYLTLKHTILCVILLTLVKYLVVLLNTLTPNRYAHGVVYVFAAVAVVYVFSVAMFAAHNAFIDAPKTMTDSMKNVWRRALQIYATAFAYLAGICVVYYLAEGIIALIDRLLHEHSALHGGSIILSTTLLFMFIAMFCFSLPISVIDNKSCGKAFYESVLLSEKNKIGIFVLFFIFAVIAFLITPGAIHEYFLSVYYLDAVFDFVVLCVGVPLCVNLLLLLINDSKQQAS